MHEGETVWVEAPVDHAPHGTCAWCGEAFEDAGDFRCIAMLTKDEDGDASVRAQMHNSIVEALTRFGSVTEKVAGGRHLFFDKTPTRNVG